MKRSMFNLVFMGSLLVGMFVLPTALSATTTTIPSSSWSLGTDSGRVRGSDALLGAQWISTENAVVRWVVWMDLGTNWVNDFGVPSGENITSATLTFNTAHFNTGTANFSIFAVPGAGGPAGVNAAIGGTLGGEAAYYAANTAYGLVTAAQIAVDGTQGPDSVSFDITNLLAGWKTGALTTNVGQMMIISDDDSHDTYWNTPEGSSYSESGGPIITITSVPEPGTFGLLSIAALAFIRRVRRRK